MDSSVLLHRRPFGSCAILFRKPLAGSVSMLRTDSNCFCAVMLTDSHGSRFEYHLSNRFSLKKEMFRFVVLLHACDVHECAPAITIVIYLILL